MPVLRDLVFSPPFRQSVSCTKLYVDSRCYFINDISQDPSSFSRLILSAPPLSISSAALDLISPIGRLNIQVLTTSPSVLSF